MAVQTIYDKSLVNLDEVKINTKIFKDEGGVISNLLEIKSKQIPSQATVFDIPGFQIKVEAISDDSGTASTSDDKMKVQVSIRTSPIPLLKDLTSKTENTWDDKFVEKLALGQKVFGAATGFLGTFLPAVVDNAKKDIRQTGEASQEIDEAPHSEID